MLVLRLRLSKWWTRTVPAMDAEVSKNAKAILERKGMTILTDTKLQNHWRGWQTPLSRLKGKRYYRANKLFYQSDVFQTLKVSVKSSLNWIVDGSRSMNTSKCMFQASMRQALSTVPRCWLTPSVWVVALKMLLRKSCCCKVNLTPAAIYTLPSCSCWFWQERTSSWNMMSKSVNSTLRRTVVPLHPDAAQGICKK